MKKDDTINLLAQPVRAFVCTNCEFSIDVSDREMLTPIQCPSCQKELIVPARMGDFIIVKLLGTGGMATVYRAYDTALGRYVAIKFMRGTYSEDPKFADRFLNEARAAARLNHPNVVQVYSCSKEKGHPYIVMELVSGEELSQTIKREGSLSEKQILQLALDISMGLSAAAEIGLVHGDIKPANIIFDNKGHAKIADFGLARFAKQKETAEDEIWGTPYYIAPEKALRQKEDQRSDIYCLGATLYHALTGVPPFDGETPNDVVLARLSAPPPDVREHRPEVSDQTAAIILRMMEVDRTRRYPNYLSLISDIKEVQRKLRQGQVTHTHCKQEAPAEYSVVGRYKWAAIIFLALLLLSWAGYGFVRLIVTRNEVKPVKQIESAAHFPFTIEENRHLTTILTGLTPENTEITRQALASLKSDAPEGSAGWYWINLFIVKTYALERDMEGAARHAGVLRQAPILETSIDMAPATLPGRLARRLLGDASRPMFVIQNGHPQWYDHLSLFFKGLRLLLDNELASAKVEFQSYTESHKEADEIYDWPYALRDLSAELVRRINTWENLERELERLLAANRIGDARERLAMIRSQLFLPQRNAFEARISRLEQQRQVHDYVAGSNDDWFTGEHDWAVLPESEDPRSLLGDRLVVWLDGQDRDSMTVDGGRVAQWNDKSGRRNHVTASGDARPTLRSNGINQNQSLEFAGQEQYMQNLSPSGLPTGNSSYTMIVLYQFDNTLGGTMHSNAHYLAAFGIEGGRPPPPRATMAAIDVHPAQRFVRWGLDVDIPNAPNFLDGNPHFYFDAYNADTGRHSLYFDGDNPRSVTLTEKLALGDRFFVINRFSNTIAQGTRVHIGEVLLISGLLDPETREQIKGYLAHKWGRAGNANPPRVPAASISHP